MAEVTRNLCAQIPVSLHSRIRQEQESSGQTLSAYMTQLITNYYHMKEDKESMNTETRTVAFQVPPELFEKFKAYLQRNSLKQKEFFLACIQRALSDEAMRTRLRLFLEWGITFGEPYQVPERAARKVAYASKLELETAILQRRQSAAERPTESPPPPPEPAAPGEKYGPNRAREELDKLHPSGSRLKDLKESEEETT